MSNLVVFDFDGIHTADEVKLRSLQKEYRRRLWPPCRAEMMRIAATGFDL
jgi:hypothetical protein